MLQFRFAQKRTKKGSRSLGLQLPFAARQKQCLGKSLTLRRVFFLLLTLQLGCVKMAR
jgi:hypothetical protein